MEDRERSPLGELRISKNGEGKTTISLYLKASITEGEMLQGTEDFLRCYSREADEATCRELQMKFDVSGYKEDPPLLWIPSLVRWILQLQRSDNGKLTGSEIVVDDMEATVVQFVRTLTDLCPPKAPITFRPAEPCVRQVT